MSKKVRIDVFPVKDPENKKKNIWIVKRAGVGKAVAHLDENGRPSQKKAIDVAKKRAKDIEAGGKRCKVVLRRTTGAAETIHETG